MSGDIRSAHDLGATCARIDDAYGFARIVEGMLEHEVEASRSLAPEEVGALRSARGHIRRACDGMYGVVDALTRRALARTGAEGGGGAA